MRISQAPLNTVNKESNFEFKNDIKTFLELGNMSYYIREKFGNL